MKKMFLILGVALVSLLFTACDDQVVSDAKHVEEITTSLRENPSEWDPKLMDDGKIISLWRKNQRVVVSLIEAAGFKRHDTSLDLEPGSAMITPGPIQLKGDALEAIKLAVQPYIERCHAELAEKARIEEEKKMIKLE